MYTSTNDNFNFYGVKDKTRIQKRLQIERGASVHMHKKPIHTIKLENLQMTLYSNTKNFVFKYRSSQIL